MSDDEFHSADEESDALTSVEESRVNPKRRGETPTKDTRGSSLGPSTSPEPPTKLAESGASKAKEEVVIEPAAPHWEDSPPFAAPPPVGLELGGDGLVDNPAAAAAVTDHWARPINAAAAACRKSTSPLVGAQTHHITETSGYDSDDDDGGGGGGGGTSNCSSPAGRRGSLDEAHDAIRLMQGCLGAPWPSQDEDFTSELMPLPPPLPPPRSPPAPVPQEPSRVAGPPGAARSVGGVTRDAVLARLAAAKAATSAAKASGAAGTPAVAAAFLPKTAAAVSPDPPPPPSTLLPPRAGAAARVALVRAVDVPE